MKLREIRIKNFRCLVDILVPVDDTTVLVGENDSGKTALLDALRIVLSRSPSFRDVPFREYDYHMAKVADSPETSEGITIELWFREDSPNEWPAPLIQALNEVVQTDPEDGTNSMGLRLTSKYDNTTNQFVAKWEFLNLEGEPLGGRGANPANFIKFLQYIRLFYLSALRDSADEFSPRSQFWGRIIRDLQISEAQAQALAEQLTRLNSELLQADPRLEDVRKTLEKAQSILGVGPEPTTSIQVMPMKPWDLMSKSEVVIKQRGGEIDFPLSRHGLGVQSLVVLFLFQAYVDVMLKPNFYPETEAILAMEEPESHIHPQAIRSLARNLSHLKGQKIFTTHSPYFIQEIPFANIRMFRRDGPASRVLYVRRAYSCGISETPQLLEWCAKKEEKFRFHRRTSTLTVNGKFEEKEYRDLLALYPGQDEVHTQLKGLKHESSLYLTAKDLLDLDTYAKRIRGEVLFARGWLLCEGQSEYLLLRFFADLLGKPLDQAGITVIDFQNNGSPRAFVSLAKVFEMPWLMICDNDQQGVSFSAQVKECGLADEEMAQCVRHLPGNNADLETFLFDNGFANDYVQLLQRRGVTFGRAKEEPGSRKEVLARI